MVRDRRQAGSVGGRRAIVAPLPACSTAAGARPLDAARFNWTPMDNVFGARSIRGTKLRHAQVGV
jgi:hypothetical protein